MVAKPLRQMTIGGNAVCPMVHFDAEVIAWRTRVIGRIRNSSLLVEITMDNEMSGRMLTVAPRSAESAL